MKMRKLVAALVAAIFPFAVCATALAATSEKVSSPDAVYYRERVTDMFEGSINIRTGYSGEVTSVAFQQGEDPSFYINRFDDGYAYYDSLFRSAEHTLLVTRAGQPFEVSTKLAVYDRVTLLKSLGSVRLSVKDNHTLQPVASAEYALYQSGKQLRDNLFTNSDGQIILEDMEPGYYELRLIKAPEGYEVTTTAVPFSLCDATLAGGDYQVRTTEGAKIRADEDEVLIAGNFSPDVILTGTAEEQIESVDVTYKNFGAQVDLGGEDMTESFSSFAEAQTAINRRKASGEICGPVEIRYTLKGRTDRFTRSFTQYLAKLGENEQQPEPAETTAPTPRPVVTPTPRPTNYNSDNVTGITVSATPVPTATPTPVDPRGTLTIRAATDSGDASGLAFLVTGVLSTGTEVTERATTNASGEATLSLNPGTYTVSLSTNGNNSRVQEPQSQAVTITTGNTSSVTFNLKQISRSFTLRVVDDDGASVPGVTIGLFAPVEGGTVHVESPGQTSDNATDISKAISVREQEEDHNRIVANPYARSNAYDVGTSDSSGLISFTNVPAEDLIASVVSAPDGYALNSNAIPVPSDWAQEYLFVCEFVKVDVSIIGKETGKAPLNAVATLSLNEVDLATWTIEEEPHRLIRVPSGKYGIALRYEEQLEEYEIEIQSGVAKQTVEIESKILGSVPLPEPKDEPQQTQSSPVVWYALGGVAFAALMAGAIILFRRHRKRSGGYQ